MKFPLSIYSQRSRAFKRYKWKNLLILTLPSTNTTQIYVDSIAEYDNYKFFSEQEPKHNSAK